jgi:hypothetical protein
MKEIKREKLLKRVDVAGMKLQDRIKYSNIVVILYSLTGFQLMPHICGKKKGYIILRGIFYSKIGPRELC